MYSEKIQKLINLFSKFPGIGPKVAERFVFYLLSEAGSQESAGLAETISALKKDLKRCAFCFKFFDRARASSESEGLCEICADASRDRNLLCVVEKETDLVSIEKNKVYHGLYFILGGTVGALKKQDIENLRIKELRTRIQKPENFGVPSSFKEIILALDATVAGEATALYLKRELKGLSKKITHLGMGLPVGGELEYTDRKTLFSAFENRK